MTNINKMTVRQAKTQISLGICAQWIAKGPSFLHADSKVSYQTGRMLGAHAILLVLS